MYSIMGGGNMHAWHDCIYVHYTLDWVHNRSSHVVVFTTDACFIMNKKSNCVVAKALKKKENEL